eukprot:TRINITY_DN3230_c0_g1_i1.p1 TRINITY_DN3230_c0_g1~~TRINITY_DN3230_c0_g1_i1.p1  ORF type:complete len:1229 (+),score=266.22 TRINITY_DN3230_c0_g1_i1:375-4061(+)
MSTPGTGAPPNRGPPGPPPGLAAGQPRAPMVRPTAGPTGPPPGRSAPSGPPSIHGQPGGGISAPQGPPGQRPSGPPPGRPGPAPGVGPPGPPPGMAHGPPGPPPGVRTSGPMPGAAVRGPPGPPPGVQPRAAGLAALPSSTAQFVRPSAPPGGLPGGPPGVSSSGAPVSGPQLGLAPQPLSSSPGGPFGGPPSYNNAVGQPPVSDGPPGSIGNATPGVNSYHHPPTSAPPYGAPTVPQPPPPYPNNAASPFAPGNPNLPPQYHSPQNPLASSPYPPQNSGFPSSAPPTSFPPPSFPPSYAPSFPPTGPPGGPPLGAAPPRGSSQQGYPPQVLPPGPPIAGMGQLSVSDGVGGLPPGGMGVAGQGAPFAGGPPVPGYAGAGARATGQRRVYPSAYPGGATAVPTAAPAWAPPPPPIGGGQMPGSPTGATRTMQALHQPQPTTLSKIDPNQIPRPQAHPSVGSPGGGMVFETRVNGSANLPPPATSQYVVKDTGNCSPRFMRCTLNQIPCSGDLLSTSAMPLAVLVQPLALQDPAEEPIQVVDFKDSGPVRCGRCKAYINPLMKFMDQGRRFICNLCGFTNETPRDYQCNLGPDGRRRDADERPELSRGTVEFVAPKDYMIREPMPTVYFFLVDVSLNAIGTGATAAACAAIQQVLNELQQGERTYVGFATYSSAIHFYSLNPNLQQPTMLVVPDVQDVYTPLPTDLLVKITECKERLEQLVASIPGMFQNTRVADSAFGAALKGAYLAMKDTGGKILAFQSVLPSLGICSLAARETQGRAATSASEKEAQKLLQAADRSVKAMATEFADFQVSVDIFLTCQGYIDVASLAVISKTTGGQLYYYFPFDAQHDRAKLYNDLRWNVIRPTGLEAVMKVRCSTGLTVGDYFGNFHRRLPAEIYLPSLDCDKTIMVSFHHDEKLPDNSEACFQSALLYTTTSGERRVRVQTLALPTSTILANLFRAADLDAQFTYFLKKAAIEASLQPLLTVRDAAVQQCVNILFTYRKYCASASSSGQLILPEALKLLPLYTLALNKSVGLRNDGRIDERAYWLSRVFSLSASLAVPLVYPRMLALHHLLLKGKSGQPDGEMSDEQAAVAAGGLPAGMSLSSEKLDQDGLFLLENGEDAMLWVANGARPDMVQQLLGVPSVEAIKAGPFALEEYPNEWSQRLNEVVNAIRGQRCSYLRLRLLKRGDPSETAFFNYLIEDRTLSGMAYVEFLVHVHRQIQNKMS